MNEENFDSTSKVHTGTVSGIVISPNGKQVLGLQKMFKDKGRFSDAFGFPGGGTEPGETIEETLKREFIQETGLSVGAPVFVSTKKAKYHHSFWRITKFEGTVHPYPEIDPETGEIENGPATWVNISHIIEGKVSWHRSHLIPLVQVVSELWAERAAEDRNVAYALLDLQNMLKPR